MKLSISNNTKDKVISSLQSSMSDTAKRYRGESSERQPVHTLYGGANLYKSDTAERLGKIASRSFDLYSSDSETFAKIFNLAPVLANSVFERVAKKLTIEAVEDFRIDFEDGYGVRSDAEEDVHAISAAEQLAIGQSADTLPPFVGIRIKGLNQETHLRGIRTLDLFLTEFVRCSGAKLPENFVVTLPKVSTPAQVTALADILDELESNLGLTNDSIKIELMIETTQSLIDPDGFIGIPKLYEAARGRCRGAHFGAYDYTSSCNVTAANQDLLHPLCDFARQIMQVSFAETGVWLSDGATNILPVEVNRGEGLSAEQLAENRTVVHRA